jgi:hypothetical protein
VCVTPLAWLMALWVGLQCSARSRSGAARRLLEAALAGGLFGLLQGLLFLALAWLMLSPAELEQGEGPSALGFSLGMTCGGAFVGALLSAGIVAVYQRRHGAITP